MPIEINVDYHTTGKQSANSYLLMTHEYVRVYSYVYTIVYMVLYACYASFIRLFWFDYTWTVP